MHMYFFVVFLVLENGKDVAMTIHSIYLFLDLFACWKSLYFVLIALISRNIGFF